MICPLTFWDFDQAPGNLQDLIPEAFRNGWIALIQPGEEALAQVLIGRSTANDPVFLDFTLEGGIILAGAHSSEPQSEAAWL